MHKNIASVAVAIAMAAALSAAGVTEASAAGAPARAWQQRRAPSPGVFAAAVPGTQLWVKRYNGPANGDDAAESVAVSPGGGTVFVAGSSVGVSSGDDYLTVAYDAATGARLWVKRYNGPGNNLDFVQSVAVSPTGDRVFVTGYSRGGRSAGDYATVAYNAASGAQLWVRRYNGPANGDDGALSAAVSPSGGTVFVTGDSVGSSSEDDYATIAYNAASGAQLWVKRYNGPTNGTDVARSVTVSPTGGTVFVTGSIYVGRTREDWDYATVAYNAASGAQLWVRRYNGPANGTDDAQSVAVTPGGGTVLVTGSSLGTAGGYVAWEYATVAYNAATGAQLWVKRSNGPANVEDYAYVSMAVSPTGNRVFVTGATSPARISGSDYTTVAYYVPTGAQLWVKRYNDPANSDDVAYSVAVGPTGGTVYVTGSSGTYDVPDYGTIAYNAATGAQLWVKRYNGPANSDDVAYSVAVSPTGNRVFVTGRSLGATTGYDCATIAYSG